MSANTLSRQISQVYNNFPDDRADGLRVGVLNATSSTATDVSATNINVSTLTASTASVSGVLTVDEYAAQTQASSITTGVTLNSTTGVITTVSSTLAAAARAEFVVTNSAVANGDIIVCTADTAGAGTPVAYASKTAAGSFVMVVENKHASAALDNTVVITFKVLTLGSAA